MNVILFGPPGSGKGTQSKVLEHSLGLKQISTGDLVRAEIAKGSDIGVLISDIVNKGEYPSDDVIFDLFRRALDHSKSGFIFDGFPRTLNQIKLLEDFLAERGQDISVVIVLDVDEESLVKRLAGRFSCKKCGTVYNDYTKLPIVFGVCDQCGGVDFVRRDDDSENAVKTRFEIYKSQTEPLVSYFIDSNKVFRVNGNNEPQKISDEILNYLQTLDSHQSVEGRYK